MMDQARATEAAKALQVVEPSKARLDDITRRIDYRMTQKETPGTYRAEFEVELDGEGKIIGVTLHKVSGLPRYDRAVEKAVRATEPFPAGTMRKFRLTFGIDLVKKPVTAKPASVPGS